MKSIFIITFLLISGHFLLLSQEILGFEDIRLSSGDEFKNAEPYAYEAALFILSTPFDTLPESRDKALKYLLMWMEGTPDYTFYIEENIGYFTRSSSSLLALYMACMTYVFLDDPEKDLDRDELKYRAMIRYLDYCIDPQMHVKSFKQLENLREAREKGTFREYIQE